MPANKKPKTQGAACYTGNHTLWATLLYTINNSVKWLVSALCVIAVIFGPAFRVKWTIIGAVASAGMCKILKKKLGYSRPSTAYLQDEGMPSSHAQSLSFLFHSLACTLCFDHTRFSRSLLPLLPYPISAILFLDDGALSFPSNIISLTIEFLAIGNSTFTHMDTRTLIELFLTIAVPVHFLALVLTYLRVYSGEHTLPQVSVGYIIGLVNASTWFIFGTLLEPFFSRHVSPQLLNAVTYLFMLLFAIYLIRKRL